MTTEKVYGLIGYPVAHSFSPLMQNAAFKHLSINAEYKLFPLQEKELPEFFKALKKNNICGLNVTVPYKQKVQPFLGKISPEAQLIGAVNTIRCSPVGLEGFNTDGDGFLKHLKDDLKFNPQGRSVAILGAGGASRAVSISLARCGPKQISLYDIDKEKLLALTAHLKDNFKVVQIIASDSIEGLGTLQADLVVNATPIGMKENDPCFLSKDLINNKALFYDVVYNPKETKLLKLARELGAATANGIGMLLYQGVLAFEIWTGQTAPVEVMREALMEGIK